MRKRMDNKSIQMVSRDGADDTPVEEFARYNAGQLLARILDADKEKRLKICNQMLDSADIAMRCHELDHTDEIKLLRDIRTRLVVERQELYQLITWLGAYKAVADSIISYAELISDDPDEHFSRAALAAKINGWASMAKTTQAKLREIQEASSSDRNADESTRSNPPN